MPISEAGKRLRETGRGLFLQLSGTVEGRYLIADLRSRSKNLDLIARIKKLGSEDRAAIRAFCEAVYETIYEDLRIVACSPRYQILRSAREQEDGIQNALVRTFKTGIRFCLLGQIRWEESDEVLDHFFRKIASRELGKERGKVFDRLGRMRVLGALPELSLTASSHTDMESEELEKSLTALVKDPIDLVIIRLRIDNLTYEDIAKHLATNGFDVTTEALRQKYARLRKDLQAKLAREQN